MTKLWEAAPPHLKERDDTLEGTALLNRLLKNSKADGSSA
jgi:hypothetical protein